MGKWKAIRRNIFDGNTDIELYNLEEDIQEQKNVADLYPEIISKIEIIMKDAHDPPIYNKFKFPQLGDWKKS